MANETCALKEKQSKDSVVEHAFSVIDSKIQYLDHQTKGIVRPLLPKDQSSKEVLGEAKSDSPISLAEVEKMFAHFEQHSRQKKLLLRLRVLLNAKNAMLVLALLTDDYLFEFTEEEIHYILDADMHRRAA